MVDVPSRSGRLIDIVFYGLDGERIDGVDSVWSRHSLGDFVYQHLFAVTERPGRLVFTPEGATSSSILESCRPLVDQGVVSGTVFQYSKVSDEAARAHMQALGGIRAMDSSRCGRGGEGSSGRA